MRTQGASQKLGIKKKYDPENVFQTILGAEPQNHFHGVGQYAMEASPPSKTLHGRFHGN